MAVNEKTNRAKGRVLIVTAGQNSFQTIRAIVQNVFGSVSFAGSIAEAKQKLAAGSIDYAIINTPLSDEFGVQSAVDIAVHSSVCIMLLVKSDVYEQTLYKTRGTGIFVLTRPLKAQMLLESAQIMDSMSNRVRALLEENAKLRRRLDELTLVNRAKLLLIEKRRFTEDEAHYYLERTAMDSALSKKEVAQEIIRELEN